MTDALLRRHSPFVQGPTAVRVEILEYMKVAIPLAIQSAQAEWGDDHFLPAPQSWSLYEPKDISHRTGPLFGIGISNSSGSKAVDFTGVLELEVMTRYSVRLYLWCYTPEAADGLVPDDARMEALRVRDDLSTLMRSTLYSQPGLSNPEVYSVQLSTIREDFSDSVNVRNASGRHLAAVVLSFDVDVEERLHQPAIGYVSEQGDVDPGVNVQADHLGETP